MAKRLLVFKHREGRVRLSSYVSIHSSLTNKDLVFATKEVVLAAGAIDSPKLLLLSGIGPSEELAKLGIKSIENLQGVGKGLRDHLFTTLTIVKKLGSTDRPAFYNDPEAVKRAREQWLKDQTGPFTVFQCAHGISFMKIDRVLQSKEFGELDEEVQRHLLEETIPSCEMITVSDVAQIYTHRFRILWFES